MNVYTQMHLYFCSTVLLFYCSPRLAQKDNFLTRPFKPSRNSSLPNPIHLLSISIDYPMTFSG